MVFLCLFNTWRIGQVYNIICLSHNQKRNAYDLEILEILVDININWIQNSG